MKTMNANYLKMFDGVQFVAERVNKLMDGRTYIDFNQAYEAVTIYYGYKEMYSEYFKHQVMNEILFGQH